MIQNQKPAQHLIIKARLPLSAPDKSYTLWFLVAHLSLLQTLSVTKSPQWQWHRDNSIILHSPTLCMNTPHHTRYKWVHCGPAQMFHVWGDWKKTEDLCKRYRRGQVSFSPATISIWIQETTSRQGKPCRASVFSFIQVLNVLQVWFF